MLYKNLIRSQIQQLAPPISKQLHKYLYESQILAFLQKKPTILIDGPQNSPNKFDLLFGM